MAISTLPDEILDLTFKELIPPFRSEALTEIYVFDTPVDLLRLRLVSKRFSRIATPLAWRRVQLRISGSDDVMLEAKKSWGVPMSRWGGSLGNVQENLEEDFSHTSSYSSACARSNISGSSITTIPSKFNSSPLPPPTPSPSSSPSLHFLFFQDHPELAAHVRVLLLSVEYQSEESGSESGVSGSGFDLAYGGDESDTESEFGVGIDVGGRRGSSSMTMTMTPTAPVSSSSSSQYLAHALRAATHGMSGLRTVLLWDSATTSGVSSSTAPDSNAAALGTNGVLAREIMSLFFRASLMKVLSLRDVDGAAFSLSFPELESDRNKARKRKSRANAGVCFSIEDLRSEAEIKVTRGFTHQQHGLKMLHLSNTRCPAQVITSPSIRGSLEVLSIELAKSDTTDFEDDSIIMTTTVNPNPLLAPTNTPTPTLRDIPWSTLKEVSLSNCVDKQDWNHFLGGFQLHQSHQLQSALTELLIGDLSGLDHNRLTQFLNTFASQPLTKLTLFYLTRLDPLTTARIIYAFPNLKSLTLLTEGELVPWQGVIDDYAQKFALLPYLETLGWNNFHLRSDGAGADPATFLALHEDSLPAFYTRSFNTLTRRARRLKCVRFISVSDCIVDSVFVDKATSKAHTSRPHYSNTINSGFFKPSRLEHNQSRSRLTVKRSNEAALHTSSWDTGPVRFDDF